MRNTEIVSGKYSQEKQTNTFKGLSPRREQGFTWTFSKSFAEAAVTLWRRRRPCGHPNNRRLWPPGRPPPQRGPNPASGTLSDCLTRSRGRAERGRGWHFAPPPAAQTGSIRRVSGRYGRYGRSHRLRPGAVRRWPAIAARTISSRGEEIGWKKNLLGTVFAETFCSQPGLSVGVFSRFTAWMRLSYWRLISYFPQLTVCAQSH